MDPRNISIQDFTYHLPDERIARYPLNERDASKLLIYKNESIAEDIYANLADYLPTSSLLIFNNTKVVEARLLFTKSTGGAIELFCLEPDANYADIEGLCKVVTLDEVKDNDYSLTPGRYVGVTFVENDGVDFKSRLLELQGELQKLNHEASDLAQTINSNLIDIL